jgi:thioester reductase-like protein
MSHQQRLEELSATRRGLLARLLDEQGVRSFAAINRAFDLKAGLRRTIEANLPEYMRPRSITVLPAFPLMHNGKVDAKALPAPDLAEGRTLVAPRTATERELLKVWQGALGIQDISVEDDFFMIGGDSIRAVELSAKINQHFRTELPMTLIFAAPRIAQVAETIDLALQTAEPGLGEAGLELPVAKLVSHVQLDESVRVPEGSIPCQPSEWKAVFLTGATGYFGSHLLVSLLERTAATVHCLVRAADADAAMSRLLAAARKYSPYKRLSTDRIVAIPGDLAVGALGQREVDFMALASKIDVIFHAGAIVNFAYPLESLRGANILGTEEMFRLAASTRVKPVHFISTVNVFSSTHVISDRRIREDHPLRELPTVLGGYAQSRWIAEGIAQLARERGIPVSIYRPSIIGGHARTGISNEADAVCRLFKGCIQLGCAPNLTVPVNIVTADFAAEATTALALEASNLGGTFHLVNHHASPFGELMDGLRAYGYELPAIAYHEWHMQIQRAGSHNALYPLLPLITHLSLAESMGVRPPALDDAHAASALGPGLACPPIDRALIFRFLDAMVERQIIEKPATN